MPNALQTTADPGLPVDAAEVVRLLQLDGVRFESGRRIRAGVGALRTSPVADMSEGRTAVQ